MVDLFFFGVGGGPGVWRCGGGGGVGGSGLVNWCSDFLIALGSWLWGIVGGIWDWDLLHCICIFVIVCVCILGGM